MPRGPRVDFPGAIHHVYARGIERREIFRDDADRSNFLGRVGINLPKWRIRCCAWAVMPNHFHLLLQSDGGLLPSFMQCLLTGYSRYFNDRHGRVGHLFQNRYKSPIVGGAGYFREAIRYIHRNPVRSGIVPCVAALQEYSWTGHRRILCGGFPDWQDTELLEAEFHDPCEGDGWIGNYFRFLEIAEDEPDLETGMEGASHPPGGRATPEAPASGPYSVFQTLLRRIALRHGIPAEAMLSGERNHLAVRARREVIIQCKAATGVPVAQLARWMGIGESAARYLLNS